MQTAFQGFALSALYGVYVCGMATDFCCGQSTLFRSESVEINNLSQPAAAIQNRTAATGYLLT
jgi:hypothetical protein